MNKTLYILVDDFSSDKKEGFFEKELPYLCKTFQKVYVMSLYPQDNKVLTYSHPNLEVLQFNYFSACNRVRVFFSHFFSIIRIYFFEFFKTHNKWFYIKNFGSVINQLVLSFSAASNLERFIKKDINADTLFYSFWFKQWIAAFSIIKIRHPELKLVSRIHGGDYDEDQIKTVLPFRYFQLKMVDKIFPVSDYGRNYLIQKFKVNPSKIITSRLGLDIEPLLRATDESKLVIVSCSSVIALKRVHLLVEILKHIEIPCKWVHFGDGDLFDELKERVKQLKHTVEFKGYIPNKDFMDYLKNNPVSIFINVSESEGIPVSMMEAIAHGIPLAGTAVCGVPEIVTEKTGILFPVDFKPEDVAKKIVEMHSRGKLYNLDFRSGIINFYMDRFFVKKNHKELSEFLNLI